MAADNSAFEVSIEKATLEIFLRLRANMETACQVVERDAKIGCPVDQGILRADIHHKVTMAPDEVTGIIGNTLSYAPMVHNGSGIYAKDGNGRKTPWVYHAVGGKYAGWHTTRGQHPQPYLENAKMANLVKIRDILAGG